MGTRYAPSKMLCPTLKGCKWGYLVFLRKTLEPRVLPWQQHNRCLSVSFVMCISGAKFEEHCSNILHKYKNMNIDLFNEKNIPKRKMPFFFTLKSPSNKQQCRFLSRTLAGNQAQASSSLGHYNFCTLFSLHRIKILYLHYLYN